MLCLTPNGASTTREKFKFEEEEHDSRALVNSQVIEVENLEPGKLIIKDLETSSSLDTSASEGKEDSNHSARRPPTEEYFGLTVLSAKLNSPYMESVCTISNQFLY